MGSRDLEHLDQAVRYVAEAERRVADQRLRIARLERGGHDTGHARDLLRLFEETTYRLMVVHRDWSCVTSAKIQAETLPSRRTVSGSREAV
jgi:hypothetical protein